MMTPEQFEVLGVHAVVASVAAELLAEASDKATADDWLMLIMAKAYSRYQEMRPEELQQCLGKTFRALNLEPIGWINGEPVFARVADHDEGSRLPHMNQDDPNRPGVGDQF